MRVRDVMRADLETVSPDATLIDLERLLTKLRISGVPVVESAPGGKPRIVGVVSRADIVKAVVAERAVAEVAADWYREPGTGQGSLGEIGAVMGEQLVQCKVADVMTRGVFAVAPDDDLRHAIELMAREALHRVLVIQDDALQGILTSMDVLDAIADGRLKLAS